MSLPVLSFPPNWAEDYRERWEYRTEVQIAHDGREIRRCTRDTPYRSLEYGVLLQNGEQKRAFTDWVSRYLGEEAWIPLWSDVTRITLTSGATTAAIDTTGMDFVVGGRLLVWESVEKYNLREITAVTTGSVSWSGGLDADFQGVILPVKKGVLDQTIRGKFHTISLESFTVQADLLATEPLGRVPSGTPTDDDLDGYDGLRVWFPRSHENDRSHSFSRRIESAEYDVGAWRRYPAWEYAGESSDVTIMRRGRAKIKKLLHWIHYCRGRWRRWWWDSWAKDLSLASAVGASDTILPMSFLAGYSLQGIYGSPPPTNRRDIVIRLKTGAVFRRRIVSFGSSSVTLASAIGVSVSPGDIDRITWLQPSRFDADSFELAWETNDLLRVNARIRRLIK